MEWAFRVLAAPALAGFVVASAEAEEAKRVLFLHSYGPDFSPFSAFASQMRRNLAQEAPWPLDVYEASLETARFTQLEDSAEPFARYLFALFETRQPDLVVAVGGPAARFAQSRRGTFFASAPLLLAGLEERAVSVDDLTAGDAVVSVRLDVPGAIDGMLEILPATEQVLVIAGISPLEVQWRSILERDLAAAAPDVRLEWLEPLGFDGVLDRVAGLPARSAVLYGLLLVDGEGVPHEEDEALAEIAARSAAPVFGLFDSQLGSGIVGGRLVPVGAVAEQAADVAVRLLDGAHPADLRMTPLAAGPPRYDARQLARWKIDAQRLPPGAEILFRQLTAWDRYRWQIVLLAAAFVFQGAFIAALLLNRRRLSQSRAALRRSEREAHELSGQLIHAQEDERARLARELHDDTTQRLAMLAISAGEGERATAGDARWREMQEELARLSEDVHAISHRLHPSILTDLGLSEALRTECARFTRVEGIAIEIDIRDMPDEVPPGTALALYRIAQEALRNVARHARASRVEVTLAPEGHGLMLQIRDDGCGFDGRARPGLGLASMRQRVAQIGGEIDVRSGPGGTTIRVAVPLAEGH